MNAIRRYPLIRVIGSSAVAVAVAVAIAVAVAVARRPMKWLNSPHIA
jgi:hypothetical protein